MHMPLPKVLHQPCSALSGSPDKLDLADAVIIVFYSDGADVLYEFYFGEEGEAVVADAFFGVADLEAEGGEERPLFVAVRFYVF
jgi:hypothetical protein